jgi:UDP-glucose 4-epimerase
LNQVLQNTPLTIFGNGEQSRAFSYISDIAGPIANSVNRTSAKNKSFNIGSSQVTTINQLASLVRQVTDTEAPLEYLPARNEVIHAYADHQNFYKVFDIQQETSLEDGVRKMAQWARTIKIKPSSNFENIEIKKNFPDHWKQ